MRDKELRIFTDAGRCMRPLFVVENSTENGIINQLVISQADIIALRQVCL